MPGNVITGGLPDALLWPGLPLWAIFLVVLVTAIRMSPQWMERWLQHLRDRAAEKAADWSRLRDEIVRLSARVQSLETECRALRDKVNECEDDRLKWMERAVAAEAYRLGQAEADQKAQRMLSAERQADAAGRGKGKGDA